MRQILILTAVLLPIFGGVLIPLIPFGKRSRMCLYIEGIVLAASAVVFALLAKGGTEVFELVHFVNDLSISFNDCAYRTISSTSTTVDARTCNYECHNTFPP